MSFIQLTLLYSLLNFFAVGPAKEIEANNIILQSKDGGRTWEDISNGLPKTEDRVGFFAGASEIYLSVNGVMYRSKNNLETPVWEKENIPDQQSTIAFNRDGVMAYSYFGHIYKKKSSSKTWSPVYTDLVSHEVASIFEVSDGTILRSTGKNFFKSTDKAHTWTLSQRGFVGDIVESGGVLVATGQKGIMRSTDSGETWEWVISDGGGIAVERIDGGFAAISYNAQSNSRRIHLSFDQGKSWKTIDEGLQPSYHISSIQQMGSDLFVGHPDGIFRSSDMGKTWQRVHAGLGNEIYTSKFASRNSAPAREKVFQVYVSGDVLFAVAVTPGC